MPQKDAFSNLHGIKDLPTREAIRIQADVVSAARVETRRAKDAGEETARTVDGLTSQVARLGGLKAVLDTLNMNVNIVLDHPWFVLGLAADQSIADNTASVAILWDQAVGSPGGFYDLETADGFVFLGRKPGIWEITLHVLWGANATGRRVASVGSLGDFTYSLVDNRDAVSAGTMSHHISASVPTVNPPGSSSAAWTRFGSTAFQNSGGPLSIQGDSSFPTSLSCFYLGPLPA
ncbi:hypothetical protein LCGC14_0904220 [marine sediment metagenome]|uniref:Uncharacterized protein n=1 Tax=marine sediment metagenome TaxID=412755 RepID=A0A0F9PG83_9ZZZZ